MSNVWSNVKFDYGCPRWLGPVITLVGSEFNCSLLNVNTVPNHSLDQYTAWFLANRVTSGGCYIEFWSFLCMLYCRMSHWMKIHSSDYYTIVQIGLTKEGNIDLTLVILNMLSFVSIKTIEHNWLSSLTKFTFYLYLRTKFSCDILQCRSIYFCTVLVSKLCE